MTPAQHSCTAFDGKPCVCWVREGACPHVLMGRLQGGNRVLA